MTAKKDPWTTAAGSQANQPWEEITMDLIVELPESEGNTIIRSVVDLFSSQEEAGPKLPSAQRLAKMFVEHIYQLHGVPRHITSD